MPVAEDLADPTERVVMAPLTLLVAVVHLLLLRPTTMADLFLKIGAAAGGAVLMDIRLVVAERWRWWRRRWRWRW